jgi:predicted NBD/HSP70 family sugar kinase
MTGNDVKIKNKINVLRLLLKKDYSRVELASILGLSKAGITGIISEIAQQDLLVEKGRGTSSELGGKKPIFLGINKDAFTILAIHFDHKKCIVALTDFLGNPLHSLRFSISIQDDYKVTFDFILGKIQKFLEDYRQVWEGKKILACGISLKGLIDSDAGILRFTSANSNWTDIPVKDYFSKALGLYTFVDNDARSIMCLDIFSSQQNEADDVNACICIEEGLGTSVTIGNRVIRGAYSCAVNYAHSLIDPQGPMCTCGKRGCVEAHCSMDALLRKSQEAKQNPELQYEDIIRLYKENDEIETTLLKEDFCYWIGISIGNFTQIFNPSKLTVYLDENLFDESLKKIILKHFRSSLNHIAAQCEIQFKQNGSQLHLYAAAALVLKNYVSTPYHELLNKRMS